MLEKKMLQHDHKKSACKITLDAHVFMVILYVIWKIRKTHPIKKIKQYN